MVRIVGARANNLKNVTLTIPGHQIVVFTGVSGSGKSSIVFDTVAAEAGRQLNETFPWFIRNRLPRHPRPDADVIEDLAPAVVVDQRPVGGGSRSTVGTMTDIHSVLRVLFSRHGRPSAGPATAYSFNDPHGMCQRCEGLGRVVRLDLDAFLDTGRTLNEGAVNFPPFGVGSFPWQLYAESGLFDPDKPLRDFTEQEWDLFLHGKGFRVARNGGANAYEGVVERFNRLYLKRDLDSLPERDRRAAAKLVTDETCPDCGGARLNDAALASRIDGRNIADLSRMEIADLVEALEAIDDPVATPIAASAVSRLRRLQGIGLGYLSLDRETPTLSGGEAQRLKVVRHLGSSLTGMLYIFDEPSTGLHPHDVGLLRDLLVQLRDRGNTVLVVEHDPDVIAAADHVVDLGPGAGAGGGQVVFEGTVEALRAADTPTGRHLRRDTPIKRDTRTPTGWMAVRNASIHNLRDVSVGFPKGVLTVVTGVAGSGKSTLVTGVLARQEPDVVVVDQSAIAAPRRATPATHLKIMDRIRRLFAAANHVDASLFSHNSKGACPACGGTGVIVTDLAFMDPVTTTCEQCHGTRYRPDVLAHTLRGRSIVDVLALTADQAVDFFTEPAIAQRLRPLVEVGLGYLTLGQPLSSLSGGERQRLKLAGHLRRPRAVYVLDEPTAGLHMADVDRLVTLLDRLVDDGGTVIVIEHEMEVVRRADWVVDLGPGGGTAGGRVLYTGPPVGLAGAEGSITGAHLRH